MKLRNCFFDHSSPNVEAVFSDIYWKSCYEVSSVVEIQVRNMEIGYKLRILPEVLRKCSDKFNFKTTENFQFNLR